MPFLSARASWFSILKNSLAWSNVPQAFGELWREGTAGHLRNGSCGDCRSRRPSRSLHKSFDKLPGTGSTSCRRRRRSSRTGCRPTLSDRVKKTCTNFYFHDTCLKRRGEEKKISLASVLAWLFWKQWSEFQWSLLFVAPRGGWDATLQRLDRKRKKKEEGKAKERTSERMLKNFKRGYLCSNNNNNKQMCERAVAFGREFLFARCDESESETRTKIEEEKFRRKKDSLFEGENVNKSRQR